MASTIHGQLPVFSKSKEDFDSYAERLEFYFQANDITDNKVSHLITHLDAATYKLLKTQVAPAKVGDKTYDQLKKVLSDHFSDKPIVIAERFVFYQRFQKQGESVSDFVAELRKLAFTCEFGDFLDQALRDRFVCGLNNSQTQRKLLTMKDLTFKTAIETSIAAEVASQGVKKFTENASGGATGSSAVNHVGKGRKSRKPHKNKEPQGQKCYRCGNDHSPSQCKYKSYKCNHCKRTGHLQSVCRDKLQSQQKQGASHANYVGESSGQNDSESENANSVHFSSSCTSTCPCESSSMHDFDTLGLYHVDSHKVDPKKSTQPIVVQLTVADTRVQFEVDTGSAKTIIPEKLYHEKFEHVPLKESHSFLKTYSGDKLHLVGEAEVRVCYDDDEQEYMLPLIVARVGVKQPAILGRDWLQFIRLNWESLFASNIMHVSELDEVLGRHPALFKRELGTMKPQRATLYVQNNAKPVFKKARPVPYALKEKLEQEYARLQKEGIIVPVRHSEWASPVVPVRKSDGSIRICGDLKVGLNDVLDIDKYPLPNPQDLFTALAGGTLFTKLDLSQAYQQMLLNENSRKYVTVNTHMGLFQYTRLPYGVASAPSLFQATMEQVLQGIEGVLVFLDDILVTGKSEEEHLKRLDLVLTRLEEHGLRLNVSKCAFLQQQVEYLGHLIDADGLHPTESKVAAIFNASEPKNVSELRSFLGMLQYYSRFIPKLSCYLKPLHDLLQTNVPWKWTPECKGAFK